MRNKSNERKGSVVKLIQERLKSSYVSQHLPSQYSQKTSGFSIRKMPAFEKGPVPQTNARATLRKNGGDNPFSRQKTMWQKPVSPIKLQSSYGTLPRPGVLKADEVFAKRTRNAVSLTNLHERPISFSRRMQGIRPMRSTLIRTDSKDKSMLHQVSEGKAIKLNTRAIYDKLKLI